MAAAYLKVYCNNVLIRTFGGNRRQVQEMKILYDNMTADDFYKKHHRIIENPNSIYIIKTRYFVKNNKKSRHRETRQQNPQGLTIHLL